MGGVFPDTFPHLGIAFSEPKPVRVVNRTGGTRIRGEMGMFDIRQTVATTWRPGRADSVLSTLVLPTVAEDGWAILAIFGETVPNGSEGLAWIHNPEAPILYEAGQDPTTPGQSLGYNNLVPRMDGTGTAAAAKVWGIAIDSLANKSAGSIMRALFNGLFGWGKG